MQMRTITCRIESPLVSEYTWVMKVFAKYIGFNVQFVDGNEDMLIAEHGMGDIQVSHFFRMTYQSGDCHFKSYFRKELLHYTASNKPDYLSTCFYLLSYLQEYTDYHPDQYGRFPFSNSIQHHFDCIDKNLVAQYFTLLYEQTPKLKQLVSKKEHASVVFLSHDIDSAYGALAENGKWLLKHGKVGALMQLIFNHYVRTPDHLLLDKIMQIEDAYDVKSVFFWLARSGRGTRLINNADYNLSDNKVRSIQQHISEKGWVNGLHKSAGKSTMTADYHSVREFAEPVNRNHYLLTELPGTFNEIEAAGIQMDCTMGFAEAPGFRNSYGLPVRPYHFKEKREYNFIEVPLHIMDTTYRYYRKESGKEAERLIIDFLENNPQDAVISILWHNNYFFDRTDTSWLDAYKAVLQYMREKQIRSVLPKELLEEYL